MLKAPNTLDKTSSTLAGTRQRMEGTGFASFSAAYVNAEARDWLLLAGLRHTR